MNGRSSMMLSVKLIDALSGILNAVINRSVLYCSSLYRRLFRHIISGDSITKHIIFLHQKRR